MSLSTSRTGLFVGLNSGKVVPRPAALPWKKRPVTRKGKVSRRALAIRETIREITGWSPLENRMQELISQGTSGDMKKATKIARQKLGTHKRAKIMREDVIHILAA